MTNASFLSRLVRHEKFVAGEIDTEFIARHESELFSPPGKPAERELLLAGLGVLALEVPRDGDKDRSSPWSRSDGWRLNTIHQTTLEFAGDTAEAAGVLTLDYLPGDADEMRFTSGGKTVVASLDEDGGRSAASWTASPSRLHVTCRRAS